MTDIFLTIFYESYILCIFENRLAEAILANTQNICYPEEYHGNINEEIHNPLIFVQTELML